jgi:NADH-quinone oxidoreductase subunit C
MAISEKNTIASFVESRIGTGLLMKTSDRCGVEILTIDRKHLLDLMKMLRDDTQASFKHLAYITAIDYPDDDYRFYVLYDLWDSVGLKRVRIKVPLLESDAWVPSVCGVYPSANWHEREMMELFGIAVRNHPDPRKLLLPDWVDEHPLRKDFPHGGEDLWEFHKKTIEMFNSQNEYQGKTDEPWLELFDT